MLLETFQKQKPLSRLCTFGIGGNASYYVEVRTIAEMQNALQICLDHYLPYFILGKGSNCLFSDSSFNGVVIHNKIDFIHDNGEGIFNVGGGYSFSLLGTQTARRGWSGLEFASGIPATTGGAVFMNAGANGTETKDSLISVTFLEESGHLREFKKEDLQFSYRTSSFQRMKGAIVGATFQLTPLPEARLRQMEILRYRQATQPYDSKSAGCVFRNPECGHAGKMIEACGLKGMTLGGAQVSTVHANFIINHGNATAIDVLTLMDHVQTKVKAQTGILLESEVRIVSNQPVREIKI